MPHKYSLPAEKLKKQFVSEYNKINPKSAKEFNLKREKGTPGWATVAKLLGVKKWSELLKLCDLKPVKKSVNQVRSIIDLEQRLKEMDE